MTGFIPSSLLSACAFSFFLLLFDSQGVSASGLPGYLGKPSFSLLPEDSFQLIVVTSKGYSLSSARVLLLQKAEGRWQSVSAQLDAAIGRNGFAKPGAKREGDGKSPTGIYPLNEAFGYGERIDTRMPYREVTDRDIWVDDPDSPDYNRPGIRGETQASSFEMLRRGDNLYKYVLVIGYNMNPVVKGMGSAIFLHIRKSSGTSTAGCVALSERDVVRILQWLDPRKTPLIIMGTEGNGSRHAEVRGSGCR